MIPNTQILTLQTIQLFCYHIQQSPKKSTLKKFREKYQLSSLAKMYHVVVIFLHSIKANVKATAFCKILDGPIMPFSSPSFIPFQMFCILITNYYCSLYNNILYLLLVMNKRRSLIRLI